jgi:hypothetical protein
VRARKKPVVIGAWRNVPCEEPMPEWLVTAKNVERRQPGERIGIDTLEGVMVAEPGDIIIRGVKGEVYPCKPDIFAATYDVLP